MIPPNVSVEVSLGSEGAATVNKVAVVRLLVCVKAQMLSEVSLLVESLAAPAKVADKVCYALVLFYMDCQPRFVDEGFEAAGLSTDEGLPFFVR